jgi:hypothetical protein
MVPILVRNYADIPRERLAKAQIEAERLLSQAGVQIIWRDLAVSPVNTEASESESGFRREPLFTLNLLSAAMEARLKNPGKDAGMIVGPIAYVFCGRLEGVVETGTALNPSMLLGNIMAHEIGHLLLGRDSHARTGLMQPLWRPGDLLHADQGTLAFSPQLIERVRNRPCK